MVVTTRQSLLVYFLFIHASLADAWVTSRGDDTESTRRMLLRSCPKDRQFETRAVSDRFRRSILQQLGTLPVGMAIFAAPSPAAPPPSGIDPFAAMDEILSATSTTNNNSIGLSSALISPGGPKNSERTGTSAIDSEEKAAPGESTPVLQQSDMAAALQESKKRRTVDPRTHG